MASKRAIRRKACEQKTRYTTAEDAGTAARRNSKFTDSRIGSYKCKFCQGWHIGHTPKSIIRAMEGNWRS